MLCGNENKKKIPNNINYNNHTLFENFYSGNHCDKLRKSSCELTKSKQYKNDKYFPANNRRLSDPFFFQQLSHATYAVDDQRIFLHGSQVLERLNGIIKKINIEHSVNIQPNAIEQGKSSSYLFLRHGRKLKDVTVYYSRLKKLLIKRYLLLLKREYVSCVGQSKTFFKECLILTSCEKQKGKLFSNMYPSQLTNSDTLNTDGLIILIEQLSKMIHQWQTFFLGFQKVATIFHPGFNIHLYCSFRCTDFSLYYLYENFIHFICVNLHIVIEKLGFTDLNNSSFDFLPKLLDISQMLKSFALHKRSNKNGLHYCEFITKSFRSLNTMKVQEFSSTNILSFFGYLQAMLAADKLMRAIASDMQQEFRTSKENFFNWISIMPSTMKQTEETSDYCSGSVSEANSHNLDHLKASYISVLPSKSLKSNAISVFNTVLQKNESFILRYFFAMEHSGQHNGSLDENGCKQRKSIASRKIWRYSSSNQLKNKSCSELKKTYWIRFWKKAHQYFVKLLMEVPYQQFGDLFAGSLLMCRETSVTSLMMFLKQNSEIDDCRDDSQSYMKNLYYCTFSFAVQVSWDKRFCSALTTSSFHRYTAVLLENGNSGTDSENSLCVMLQPLLAVLMHFNSISTDNFQVIKTLHQLQSSLKYYQNWAIIRERTYISSWNIPQYLLTSFDIAHFLCLMDMVIVSKKIYFTFNKKSLYLASSVAIYLEKIWDIHAAINCLSKEMPRAIHKKAYLLTMHYLTTEILALPCWKFKRRICEISDCMKQIIEEILTPVFEIFGLNKDKVIWDKIVSFAVVQAYIDFLQKRKIRFYGIRLITTDIHELTIWLRKNLSDNRNDEIEIFKLIENLYHALNSLTSNNVYTRRLVQSRNSVCPLLISNESFVT